jgi:hypothetical protein
VSFTKVDMHRKLIFNLKGLSLTSSAVFATGAWTWLDIPVSQLPSTCIVPLHKFLKKLASVWSGADPWCQQVISR